MSSDVIRTLKWVFGKGGLIEEYKRQEQMLEETPKSVASMTRIFAPQISRDFPGMNLEQFEALAQQQLCLLYTSRPAVSLTPMLPTAARSV